MIGKAHAGSGLSVRQLADVVIGELTIAPEAIINGDSYKIILIGALNVVGYGKQALVKSQVQGI